MASRQYLPVAVLCVLAAACAPLRAQDAASPQAVWFVGPGVARTAASTRRELQAGLELDEAPPNSGAGFLFEAGYLAGAQGAGFLSIDWMSAWHFGPSGRAKTPKGQPYWVDRGWKLLPFALAGYSHLFKIGNAFNFGGGADYRLSHTRAIRFELRDYHSGSRDDIGFRIGLVLYIAD